MSNEEDKQELLTKDKHIFCGKLMVILVSLSLLFSLCALAFSLIAINNSGGFAGSNDPSRLLISKKYDKGKSLKKALKKQKTILAFFYVDWCGYCKAFAPTFNEITKDKGLKKDFAFAYINCEDEKNQQYVKEYDVTFYPSVFVIKQDGTKERVDNHMLFGPNAKANIIKSVTDKIVSK